MSKPEPKWKPGDPVIIERPRQGRIPNQVISGKVAKVARKYFTVTYDEHKLNVDFEIATGKERSGTNYSSQYVDRAYTPDEWETVTVRRELVDRIRAHRQLLGIQFDFGYSERRWDTLHLLELLQLLDRVADAAKALDLDAVPVDRL